MSGISRTKCPFIPGLTVRFKQDRVSVYLRTGCPKSQEYARMIKAVLPYMKSQERGIIHNVSSGVGITGFPGIYGYASTKGAIEALTLTLAFEFEKYGISVNTIHPPLTNTKSASQLGIPTQVMADAAKVGQQLAGKILSTTPVVTPNLQTRLYLYLSRRFPGFIGRFIGKMTEKEREKISHN
jgi:NAD(P)-dependent dehydrogenase (short-subunit alcohol dehydrogenase family)